jgi:ribonuclease HII
MSRRIDPKLIPPQPNLTFERDLWKHGISKIAGVDEAGRGALAGPVAAAAVILPQDDPILIRMEQIRDSKQLDPGKRDELRILIERLVVSWGVGLSDNLEIDQFGIAFATRLAVHRAVSQLSPLPDHLLVDYIVLPDEDLPQTRLVKGDARSLSIAAASILAKTHRDQLLISLDKDYPLYGLKNNKGYGTQEHRQAIRQHGPCPIHRLSFAPMGGT